MARRVSGYSLIELLVVMVILGVLATAAMPLAELAARRSKERELKQALWEVRHAIDAYKSAWDSGQIARNSSANGYPPSLEVLVTGVPDVTRSGQTLYFLRRIPTDPFSKTAALAEQSWGLRSYASSAEQPKAGDDVYDVHSKSDNAGINGVPYSQW